MGAPARVHSRTPLAVLEEGRRLIAEARSLPELIDLRDQAAAVQHYLRKRKAGLGAMNDAAELKLRAERRLGEMLKETVRHVGGRPRKPSHDSRVLPEGITWSQSSRWQLAASLPGGLFEDHIERMREGGELTTKGVLSLAKKAKAASTVPPAASADDSTRKALDLAELLKEGLRFGTIYADPPWSYGNQGTRAATDNHYPTMTLEDIGALPVGDLAAEQCHLHLWTTNGFLREALALLAGWGFEFKSTFVWTKPQLGIGNYWRCSHELMLLGVRGGLTFPPTEIKSWLEAPRQAHSAKPERVRALIERVSPGPRLEMFARRAAPGWVSWGNQIEDHLFDTDVKEGIHS